MTTPRQPKPATGRTLQPSNLTVKKFDESRVYPESGPDQYGQALSGDKDKSRAGKPPADSVQDHYRSDVDSGPKSQHHTLGNGRNQAAPGNHTHDGVTSKLLYQSGTVVMSFTSQSSVTQSVQFPQPFANIPIVMTNIASNVAGAVRWNSRAVTVTTTGFTMSVFKGDGADAAQTWTNVPVQWIAAQ